MKNNTSASVVFRVINEVVLIYETERTIEFLRRGKTLKFEEIIACEVLIDKNVVGKTGLGKALAGGILFGGVGLLAGALAGNKEEVKFVDSMVIQIKTKLLSLPLIDLVICNKRTKVSSEDFRLSESKARTMMSAFELIIENVN